MTEDVVAVASVADIRAAHADITGRDAEAIRAVLNDHAEPTSPSVVWIAAWLTDEKPLEYVHGDAQVAAGVVQRETDKAWCWGQADRDEGVWLPKSQTVVFRAADGVSEITSDQLTLG